MYCSLKHDKATVLHLLHGSVNQTFPVAELIKQASVLILTSENYAHYQLLSLKCGIKLEERIKSGALRIIDLFSLGSPWITEELPITESLPKTWLETPGKQVQYEDTVNLIEYLEEQLREPTDQIIIDDLMGLLLNLQVRDESSYSANVPKLLRMLKSAPCKQLHIVASAIAGMDTIQARTLGYLTKVADAVIHITPNSSGYSKDVDGQILVDERGTGDKILFKLEGSSLKTLSAVKVW